MDREIQKKSESEMLSVFPLKGKIEDWYFRVTEISNNIWEIEGSDSWGRKVSCQGSDPESLLSEAEEMANSIKESS